MASVPLRRFSSTTPHFFRIILDDSSKHRLKIPKKFVMKYKKDLSSSVRLELPSGSQWEVELTRCKGLVWFEKGWKEFSMFCSLDYGSFLVFRYEGNSHFHVCIFDVSATEVDYPIKTPKIEQAEDLSTEILEDFQVNPKTRRKSPVPYPPHKKMRISLSGKAEMLSEIENTQPCCDMFEKPIPGKDLYCSKSKARSMENKGRSSFPTKKDGGSSSSSQTFLKRTPHHEAPSRMKQLTVTEKANAFKSDKPPSFRIVLQPSSIKRIMSIPNEFAKRYLMNFPAGIAFLKVSDGRTWPVEFKYDHANSRGRLLKGWPPFVRDNKLKVGDVCDFTLVNNIELLFEVAFLPTTECADHPSPTGHGIGSTVQDERTGSLVVKGEPECSLSCGIGNNMSKSRGKVTQMPSSLRTSRANLEAASKFSPKNPSFKVTLGTGHTLYVPDKFARSFIRRVKQTGTLQVKDKSWQVNLIASKYAISVCGGWTAFRKENGLREGDVCIFELMEMKDIVMKVHIFRC